EHRFGDARRLGPLCERLPGALRSLGLLQAAQLRLIPVDRRQRAARDVIDELRRDAAVGAEHRHARALRRALDLRAHTATPFEPLLSLREDGHARFPTLRWTYSPS